MSEPETLLVVDDNDDNRDILTRRLEKRGYRVRQAHDGRAALAAVDEGGLALVVLDWMMPGLSGLDVLREIRTRHAETELPVIMATAKGESEDMVEALGAGANDYVTKPLDFPVVLARVEAQLRLRRLAQASHPTPPPVASTEPTPGTVLAGRYRLDAAIGAGAFGTVYRGRHLDLDRGVAIKVLRATVLAKPHIVTRFRREGISACRVAHANAVTIYDFGVTPEGVSYLVMELLHGRSLAEELEAHGRLPPAYAGRLMVPVCDVLEAAHRAGIIHRDIKPPNVFLHSVAAGVVVKVCDFGIAKIAGDPALEQITIEGGLVGTPAYMAPERLRAEDYDGRSDVFSVGVTLYKLLSGRHPWIDRASSKEELARRVMHDPPPPLRPEFPDVPPALEALVMDALAKDAKDRPSAGELAGALARVLDETPAVTVSGSSAPAPAPETAPTELPPEEVSISMEISGSGDATAKDPPAARTRTLVSGGNGER